MKTTAFQYFRLLRLQDQYPFLFASIIAGIYIHEKAGWIVWWGIGSALISVAGFILNEWIDRQDVDVESWNPIHIEKNTKLNPTIVGILFVAFTLIGMGIAQLLGLLIWGLAICILWFLYSVKPVRLKGIFFLDLLTQLTVMFLIPFFAVLVKGKYPIDLPVITFLTPLCLITISGFFQYQLADIEQDKKAGLYCIHVVLGMRRSIIFGLMCALLGLTLFFVFRVWEGNGWSWVAVPIGTYTAYRYYFLLTLKNKKKQLIYLQQFICRMKPLSQLLVPYVLVWWILG